jgi:UDP-N-acetylglucosamine 2-epimerase (non-hydrolysing)
VQGDTTSALAAALAAAYSSTAVGHVEAGLRSHDRAAPFPEELNRVLIDHAATFCFAPTADAARHLRDEGTTDDRIAITGNTGIDAMAAVLASVSEPARGADEPRTILVTCHRRENFGAGVRGVCAAVRCLAAANRDVRIIWVLHPNPSAGAAAAALLGGIPRVELTPPLSYVELLRVLRRAHLVLSDSGGLQEEAPVLGKPVLVLRTRTERNEGIEAGVAALVGTDSASSTIRSTTPQ